MICKNWANINLCSHTLTVTNVILRQLPPEKRFASCDVVKLLQAVDASRGPDALKGRAKGPKNPNFLDKAPVNQKGQYKNSRNEQKAAAAALKGLSRKGKREAKQRALKIKAANDAACQKKALADNAKAVKASAVAKPKKTISKEQAPDVVLYSTLYCIVYSHCIALYCTCICNICSRRSRRPRWRRSPWPNRRRSLE